MKFATSLILAYSLILIGIFLYLFRYDFGLKAPNFKSGDCVVWNYDNEFEVHSYPSVVVKVGKTKYLLGQIYKGEVTGLTSVETVERVDSWYEQASCKDLIKGSN
jgi:Ni,Fe-hydrogenase I cytochrome b subunit